MLSHPGRVRKGNEDACAASPADGVFVVCDGMGGAAAGEIASQLATKAFLKALEQVVGDPPESAGAEASLYNAVHEANHAVYQHSRRSLGLRGMGTTLVGLLLKCNPTTNELELTLVHVGDSRCYLLREGVLTQLTQDHSLVEEQVRLGELTVLEAARHPMRNIITRAVGSQAKVVPELCQLDPRPGDLYLLASDGLTRELDDTAIARVLNASQENETREDGDATMARLCHMLVDEANRAGGEDNITVLLLALS